jgi:small subunit ribosomal protein S7
MSRRHAAEKRLVLPDPKFHDYIVAKFTNCVMERGKKSIAERIVYGSFDLIEQRMKTSPLEVFRESVKIVSPAIEVRSRRIGGATYKVPVKVRDVRAVAIAIRLLIRAARLRSEKTMRERLAGELMDAYNKRGTAFAKCQEIVKTAEANRAYSHFSW